MRFSSMRFSLLFITLLLIAGVMTGIAGASISTGEVTPATTEAPVVNPQPVTPEVAPTEQPFSTPTPVVTNPIVIPGGESGYFSVNSVPSGADCYFDGTWQGETPAVVTVSTTGNPKHTISLSLEGYQSYTTTYNGNPGPGQTIPITATLTPIPQAGSIQVTSNPSGATAILDGARTGTTTFTFGNVPIGSHYVEVYLSGYQTYSTTVTVQQGQTMQVYAPLSPTQTIGSLSITSSPSGATVYVDGSYRGVTPATVGNLQAGTHNVALYKAGYKDWSAQITIYAGQTTYLSPKLDPDPQPAYGTVSIVSNPSGADVYGDGVYIGRTVSGNPLVFTQVKPGSHTLLLTKSGYQDYTSTGTVVAGKNYDLTINLLPVPNPTTGSISVNSAPLGADVYINNIFRGLAPVTVDGLTPGSYTILVRLSGYQDWQSSSMVSAGSTAQVSAVLIPASIRTETPTPVPTKTPVLPATAVLGLTGAAAVFIGLRKK
jgi:PEGA domain